MTPQAAVDAIWADICGRSGGDAFLEPLDADIQEEIKCSWREIINRACDHAHRDGFRQGLPE